MPALPLTAAPAPGVYPGTPMELYHAWEAASNSRLSRLARSAAHLRAYLDTPGGDDTPARLIGRALHTAVLEPDDFPRLYTVADQCLGKKKDGERCTNTGSLELEAGGWACGVHAGKCGPLKLTGRRLVLTPDDHAVCLGVRDSVHKSTMARGILYAKGRLAELSLTWNDATTGQRCKARPDLFSPFEGGTIADVKSCVDASEDAFMLAVWKWRYYRQAALYTEGAEANDLPRRNWIFIACEKEPPYAVATYRLTEGAIDAGAQQIRGLLERYQRCVDTGAYPGYPDRIVDLALPDFAWSKIDATLSQDAA